MISGETATIFMMPHLSTRPLPKSFPTGQQTVYRL